MNTINQQYWSKFYFLPKASHVILYEKYQSTKGSSSNNMIKLHSSQKYNFHFVSPSYP